MRKDIEDIFGIMKARHRILRGKIALHNPDDIDAVFFACAILHNMLLEDDGWAMRHQNSAFWSKRGAGDFGVSGSVTVEEEDDEYRGDQFDYSGLRNNSEVRAGELDLVEEREGAYHVLRAKLVENFAVQWTARKVERLK
mmetsp:Transcript_1471/g.5293  ORF Transcript_1471/g.5293 Transcript_1471/m.5293 type:complete len:140 (+) Transcript_1471:594-1013(+)